MTILTLRVVVLMIVVERCDVGFVTNVWYLGKIQSRGAVMQSTELNTFAKSYLETALWSSTDDDGTPLDDAKYSELELSHDALVRLGGDCERFQKDCEQFDLSDYSDSKIAHDFWLTRNRHGAGFWDGDYPEPLATQLTDLAHSYGECYLYVGDDGKLYVDIG